MTFVAKQMMNQEALESRPDLQIAPGHMLPHSAITHQLVELAREWHPEDQLLEIKTEICQVSKLHLF